MSFSTTDHRMMARALRQAERGAYTTRPNPMVGCVIAHGDEVVGEEATRVFADAQAMLKQIVDARWLTANAVVGFWPANTVQDDDIALYTDESRQQVALTWHGLRQQAEKQEDADQSDDKEDEDGDEKKEEGEDDKS